jgi:hypothetical protein
MATTTTNYGFDVPTSSDLVKNGATAISTLGQDIDTFLFRPFNKNAALNGAMDIWQRGTSFSIAASTSASSSTYLADRWQTFTNANQAITVSRQVTNDTTNLPFIQYCLRYQRNSGQTGTGILYLGQSFESVNSIPFAGRTVTFSFYARAGANYSATSGVLGGGLFVGTGTDQNALISYTGSTNAIPISATLTTTWQRFSFTGSIGATVTELAPLFTFTPTGTASTNDYFEVTGIQIEAGSQATPFSRMAGTLQGELAACQRYYFRTTASAAYSSLTLTGQGNTTTLADCMLPAPVTMRTYPTSVDYANVALSDEVAGVYTGGTLSISGSVYSNQFISIRYTHGSAALTTYRVYKIIANNNSSAYVGVSAEL